MEKKQRLFSVDGKYKGVPSVVTVISEEDQPDFIILIGSCIVQEQELRIRFLMKKGVKNADFLVREVSKKTGEGEDGPIFEPIWSYKMVKIEKSLNRLALIGDQFVIVVTTRDTNYRDVVKQVYPIEGLLNATPITSDDDQVTFFGASMNSAVTLGWKKRIVREYGVYFEKTPAEEVFSKTATQFEEEDDQAKKAAKMKARADIRDALMQRSKRTTYHIESGRPLHGIVLTQEENWTTLNDNTPVITQNKDGNPLEFFFVEKKEGGKYGKRGVKTGLSWQAPKPAAAANAFKIEKFAVVRISADQAEFLVKKGIQVAPGAMEVAVVPKANLSVVKEKVGNTAVFQLVGPKSTQLVCLREGVVYTIPKS